MLFQNRPNIVRMLSTIFLFCLVGLLCPVASAPGAEQDNLPPWLLDDTGIRGGLVVHLGCGDGKITSAMHLNDSYIVHGLTTDAAGVDEARENIRRAGLYGKVSVEHFAGGALPYAEDLVNLIVVDTSFEMRDAVSEILRVLAPRGVALVRETGNESWLSRIPSPVSRVKDGWAMFVKPVPADIDEWTHFLHDASNNAVARDRRVGPPARMQWKVGPLWSRSHEHVSSVAAMISGGGRLFYVVDEGLTSITHNTEPRIPERWMLVARDAFNGVLLWKRPLPDWRGDEWKNTALRGRPASVPKRIVTDGDRLYATLSHRAGVSILDPATGEILQTIADSEGAQELVQHGTNLIVYIDEGVQRRGEPSGTILAFDVDRIQPRWRTAVSQFVSQSLSADGERVIFGDGIQLRCLSMTDGSELWRVTGAGGRERTILLCGETVLEAGGPKIVARDAATGETRWTAPGGQGAMRAMDLFVAQGCAWHASDGGITGYDLATGKAVKTLDPSSVQSDGHHLRCYRAKATERFLITQFRGAEFVSLADENHANCDWVRGACRHGVVPANGLLYAPPNPCFCYPGAKLTGLLALAPAGSANDEGRRTKAEDQLKLGPAFGEVRSQESGVRSRGANDTSVVPHSALRIPHSSDWPTYRHDARRSGATACEVPADVRRQWQVSLPGPITPPVVVAGRVYVAAKDEHTLHVRDASDGRPLWDFVAGGRIDSPPTIYEGLVLFGCADGRVYCLRVSDGALVWRYRVVPQERRIVAFNQLESAWRVHGSVLVTGGVAYVTAGRSSFLDGGLRLVGLDPRTGAVKCAARLDTSGAVRQDFLKQPFIPSYHVEGSQSDILVAEGDHIYLTQYMFDRNLVPQPAPYLMPDPDNPVKALDITKAEYTESDPDMEAGFAHFRGFHRYMEKAHPQLTKEYMRKYGGLSMGDRKTGRHLATTSGFLDDTWFNRTFWMYSHVWPGWYHAHRGAKSGQLLVVGPEKTYAVQAFPTRNRQSPLFKPDDKGYLLVADANDTEPVLDEQTRGATKGMGYTRLKPPVWFDWVPVRMRGMVLADECLFVAGPPDVIDPDDPMSSFDGRKGGVLRAYSASDGRLLAEQQLDAPPIFDGLIAAEKKLFVSTVDGRLECYGAAE